MLLYFVYLGCDIGENLVSYPFAFNKQIYLLYILFSSSETSRLTPHIKKNLKF